MIVQKTVNKDQGHQNGISRTCNELGLKMGDFLIIDWSPHYAILVYDDKRLDVAQAPEPSQQAQGGQQKKRE